MGNKSGKRWDSGDILLIFLIIMAVLVAGWIWHKRSVGCEAGSVMISTSNPLEPFACVKGYIPPAM